MKLSTLVFRSMRKNIKHYFLYFFALIFSTTLYFSFLTISTNDSVTLLKNSNVKAGAAFSVGSIILLIIVVLFVFYANQLFMKRRSKEIGLYQMIGMPKSTISWMILVENIILWIIAIATGIALGFFFSRLFTMAFLKVIKSEQLVTLYFSPEALWKTIVVFAIVLVVIMLQTIWIISRSKLLDLFHAESKAEQKIKKISFFKLVIGLFGIVLIVYGYYRSTVLFKISDNVSMNDMFISMGVILGTVIIGTFLVFRYSVAFIMNLIRSSKKGHLRLGDVLAVTPIMHRMKSSSLSLSLITILTGLALGILSLGYIAYYGAESTANQSSPYDFIILNQNEKFEQSLKKEEIEFTKYEFTPLTVQVDTRKLLKNTVPKDSEFNTSFENLVIPYSQAKKVIPDLELSNNEAYLSGYSQVMASLLPLKADEEINVDLHNLQKKLIVKEIAQKSIVPSMLTYGSYSIIVPDAVFDKLKVQKDIRTATTWKSYTGYNIHPEDVIKVQKIYDQTTNKGKFKTKNETMQFASKNQNLNMQIEALGLVIFIAGFIGFAFLLATGSILYFKQMSEAEEEKASFTTLRKIGFTEQEIMKGIILKQIFSFGLPLLIGVLHSYFAVKSGWMFFGSELTAPLFITISIYVALYSIFAVFTTLYYKKIVKQAL